MIGAMTKSGITMTGVGRAAAPPDVVRLELAAEASAPTVQGALAAATNGQAAMRATLHAAGVSASDLRTTQTSVHVDYSHGDGPRGYVARLAVSATVRDVAAAGAVVSQALEAAGETARLDGLTFSHADPSDLMRTAREAAFADARAKAEHFAALAGQSLGEVLTIDEGGAGGGPVPVFKAEAAYAADMAVDPGEQEVSATVTVSWSWV